MTVYRDEADVFDPAALASFEGKDVTRGHPVESVGPVNHAAYSKGHVQNVRRRLRCWLNILLLPLNIGKDLSQWLSLNNP